MSKVLILTALPTEARAMIRALGGKSRNSLPARFPEHTPPLEVHTIGIGGSGLSDLPRTEVASILMVGLAGALDPSLRIGDIVVDGAADETPLPSSVRRGAIYTSNRLVSTPVEKAALFQQTGALAVDMEQAGARHFAASLNVPFLGVRAISDTADQTLDPVVLGLTGPDGSLKIPALLAAVARRPALLPYLKRLGTNSDLALRNLGAAVAALTAFGAKPPP